MAFFLNHIIALKSTRARIHVVVICNFLIFAHYLVCFQNMPAVATEYPFIFLHFFIPLPLR